MAAAAEVGMEARIARLESDVGHLRSDVADIRQNVRLLGNKLDVVESRLREEIRLQTSRIGALKDSLHSAKAWALTLYVALAGAMLGTMARGFGWL